MQHAFILSLFHLVQRNPHNTSSRSDRLQAAGFAAIAGSPAFRNSGNMTNFPGRSACSLDYVAVGDYPSADSSSECDTYKVFSAVPGTLPHFTQRGTIGIIIYDDRQRGFHFKQIL
ncbi:Uncharacterised protein [Mycobacteroides abscessus subsp. abscessus]|nr:Uncharacterised protein [Mycobacteroides abscessus subsp. abscessus]